MQRPLSLFALLTPMLLAGCADKTYLDPNYCGNKDGDAFCVGRNPERPYCTLGFAHCWEAAGLSEAADGCVAEAPDPACHTPCGINNPDNCLDPTDLTESSSSTTVGDTEPTTTGPDPDTSTTAGPTTGPECVGDEDCPDPAAPVCVAEACMPCSAATETTPDEACAAVDPATPLCIGDACVQCDAENTGACDGTTPLCDADNNTCVACSFHEQCQDLGLPACNIATGACFSGDAVSMVNAGTSGALQAAIDGVGDGAEHAIRVTGSGTVNHTVTIDGGKTIAIVSTNTSTQEVRGASGNPTLTVTGDNSTVYLHRLSLTANTNDVGISVENDGTLYADSVRIAQNSGGGIVLASGTNGVIRNCMVAGEGGNPGDPAILSAGSIDVLYSTLGMDFNNGSAVLECSAGSASLRNSIVVSETNAAGNEVDCAGLKPENSALRSTLAPMDWFGSGFASGNYTLNATGRDEFTDLAVWQDGDPPFDFDGDPRPNTDGSPDLPGADAGP